MGGIDGIEGSAKEVSKVLSERVSKVFSRGEFTKRGSKRTDPGRCVFRRGVVTRSSVKEVPECSLRGFPKMALVEASNAVLAKKKSSKRELCECGVKSVYRVNFQNRVLEGRI